MGVKPLFYYPTADSVLFGSEPKAILAHPSVQPRVNKDGFRELLVLAKNPECTIYAGMCEVRPGQVVRVNRNGLTKRRYWMLTAHEHNDDLPRTIRTVTELLEDIVQRQIVADVPLCSLLSGGLDSSAVTAMAHRAIAVQQQEPLPTVNRRKALSAERSRRYRARQASLREQTLREPSEEERQQSLNLLRDFRVSQSKLR